VFFKRKKHGQKTNPRQLFLTIELNCELKTFTSDNTLSERGTTNKCIFSLQEKYIVTKKYKLFLLFSLPLTNEESHPASHEQKKTFPAENNQPCSLFYII